MKTFIILFIVGLIFISCNSNNEKCSCKQNEMLHFVADLSAQYCYPINKDQIRCKKISELWLVKFDTLKVDNESNSLWDNLYDSKDPNLRLIVPVKLSEKDLEIIQPLIRKTRSNGYNFSHIIKIDEDSTYSFEITSENKMERIIQQRYKYKHGNWVWIENKIVWKDGSEGFRIGNLK